MARRLRTLVDVRRYIASLINRVEAGLSDPQRLDPAVAGRLGYLANLLRGAIVESDLETRLATLEEQFKRGGENGN